MVVDQVICKDPVEHRDIAAHVSCAAFLFELADISGGVGEHPPGTEQQQQRHQ